MYKTQILHLVKNPSFSHQTHQICKNLTKFVKTHQIYIHTNTFFYLECHHENKKPFLPLQVLAQILKLLAELEFAKCGCFLQIQAWFCNYR